MKKGVEIQFTWIFILIVGAIIFAFLMGVIGKQKGLAEDRDALAVKSRLASTFAVAQSGSSTSARMVIPETTITFTCDDPLSLSFRVGARGASDIVQGVVFSQKSLKGNSLLTWTQDWKLPYSAGNFLYLANPKTRFIFYKPSGSEGFINWLLEDFPDEFDKVIITDKTNPDDQAVLRSSGFDTYVIVQEEGSDKITDNQPNNLAGFRKASENVFVLTLNPVASDDAYGEIDFHRYKHSDDTTEGTGYYYRKELLYGALFAPEFDHYTCLMQRAFIGAKAVTELHFRRVTAIDTDAKASTGGSLGVRNPRCENMYYYIMYAFDNETFPYCGNVGIMEDIVKLISAEKNPMSDGQDPTSGTGDPCNAGRVEKNDFQRLEDNYYRILRETEDISLEGSCPYVY